MLLYKKYFDEDSENDTTPTFNFDKTGIIKNEDGTIVIQSQDVLNKINANNRKKLQEQNTALVTQLEELKNQATMSAEQREALEERIDSLQNEYMTKEQLAAKELKKKESELATLAEKAEKQSKDWEQRYSKTIIQQSLADAAIENKAVSPYQIYDMLVSKTKIKPELVDGQETGNYIPVVSFNDTDEDGNPITLELSPMDAVKRMSEITNKYGNLFISEATGGAGSLANQDAQVSNSLDKLKSTESYMEFRKKGGTPDKIQF